MTTLVATTNGVWTDSLITANYASVCCTDFNKLEQLRDSVWVAQFGDIEVTQIMLKILRKDVDARDSSFPISELLIPVDSYNFDESRGCLLVFDRNSMDEYFLFNSRRVISSAILPVKMYLPFFGGSGETFAQTAYHTIERLKQENPSLANLSSEEYAIKMALELDTNSGGDIVHLTKDSINKI